jgi:hypothetical protein
MKKPEQELAEIKSMMERSSRFLSLSGLSGILVGVYSLIGAFLTWNWIYGGAGQGAVGYEASNTLQIMNSVLLTAVVVLVSALATAYLLSLRKSKKTGSNLWSPVSRRFLLALFIPIFAGGLFSFALLHEGYFHMISGTTLIFYGLGLINASNFTLGEIKTLGFGQLILGLAAAFHPEFGLILWALGFGLLHVIYGSMMYFKYDR